MRMTVPSFVHLLQRQALYHALSVFIAAIFWAIGQDVNPFTILVYSVCLGNITMLAMERARPLYSERRFRTTGWVLRWRSRCWWMAWAKEGA